MGITRFFVSSSTFQFLSHSVRMMKTIRLMVTLLTVVLCLSVSAQIRLRAKSPFGILTQRKVIIDLALSQEQQDQIKKLNADYRSVLVEIQTGGFSSVEDAQNQIDAAGKDSEKKLRGVLTEAQWTRRMQLSLQLGGPGGFAESPYAEQLKLTDLQRKQVSELLEAFTDEMADLQSTETDAEQMNLKRNAATKKYREQAEKLLTEEQTKMLAEMKGKPLASA
jgi:hypothetical protein